MITNADITIYKKQYDPKTRNPYYAMYYIQGVSWYEDNKVTASAGGIVGGNIYKIRIPEEALLNGQAALKSYLPPGEYHTLPGEEQEGFWTVENGDYFCKGQGKDVEKPSDLAKQHIPYGQVHSIGDNRHRGLPHIRLGGW